MPGRRQLILLVVVLATLAAAPAQGRPERSNARDAEAGQAHIPTPSDGFHRHMYLMATGEGDPVRHADAAMISAASSLAGVDTSDKAACNMDLLVPAGDLTGDGLEDVLEYNKVPERCFNSPTTKVAAREGTTGKLLWRRTFPGTTFLLPSGQLNVLGGEDLIAFGLEGRPFPGGYGTRTFTYLGISGIDGSTLWTVEHQGLGGEISEGPATLYFNLEIDVPLGIADVTGDGAKDLLVGRYQFWDIDEATTDRSEMGFAGIFTVLSGATGTAVATMPGTDDIGYPPEARYIPDWNGDGLAEVAVISTACCPNNGFDTDVVVYSGLGGAPLWTHGLWKPGPPSIVGGEFTGDGRGDVMVTSQDWVHIDRMHLSVISRGLTPASQMWTSIVFGCGWPEAVPDVSGDGGSEVLLLTETEDRTMEARLFRGSGMGPGTGSELLIWERPGWTIQPAGGDLTGDGAVDLLFWERLRDQESGYTYLTTEVVSGRDASTVWSSDTRSGSGQLVAVGADGNGNGTTDLALVSGNTSFTTYRLVEGSNGSPLWSGMLDMNGYLWMHQAALLQGEGDDILEVVAHPWNDSLVFRARSGETGDVIWTAES